MMKKLLTVFVAAMIAVALAGCAQASDKSEPSVSGEGIEGANSADGADGTEGANSAANTNEGEGTSQEREVPSYMVARVDGEPDWGSILQLEIDNQQWLEPVDITAHAQLCYSDEAFYVRMWAEEASIRAEYPESDLLANTYEDSCLEFFISPVSGDPRYLNFEFNPNCAVAVQIGTTKVDRTRLVRADNPYEAVSTRTENGWEVTYKVPFDFIRQFYPDFTVGSGMRLRGNFYKCGNLTVKKHYLSWSPIESDTPNFHLPECFGELVLE